MKGGNIKLTPVFANKEQEELFSRCCETAMSGDMNDDSVKSERLRHLAGGRNKRLIKGRKMYDTHFEYIEENLNRILQNPDSVLYLRTEDVKNKRALFALIKEGPGVYIEIPITRPQSKLTYPFEPLYWFYNGPGYDLLQNFAVLNQYDMALNKNHLNGFAFKMLAESKRSQIGVYATFYDGSSTFVARKRAREIGRQGGLQSYMSLFIGSLGCDISAQEYESYEVIEHYYTGDGTFVIPSLQDRQEDHQKKLIITP